MPRASRERDAHRRRSPRPRPRRPSSGRTQRRRRSAPSRHRLLAQVAREGLDAFDDARIAAPCAPHTHRSHRRRRRRGEARARRGRRRSRRSKRIRRDERGRWLFDREPCGGAQRMGARGHRSRRDRARDARSHVRRRRRALDRRLQDGPPRRRRHATRSSRAKSIAIARNSTATRASCAPSTRGRSGLRSITRSSPGGWREWAFEPAGTQASLFEMR